MSSYKLFILPLFAGVATLLCNGCEDKEATYIANQTKHYINEHNQIKRAADDVIAGTSFRNNVEFEFAKIKKVYSLYHIVCYSVKENGNIYQAGFHVMKRNNNWEVVRVTNDWQVLQEL